MSKSERFKKRYQAGDIPWDIARPDYNLTETVRNLPIKSCKALDIGCGMGDNSIWLTKNGFDATGTDIAELAIEYAQRKALRANVKCVFIAVDFLTSSIKGTPFGFAFDRGCFHSFDSDKERKKYAKNVSAHLEKNGLWLTIVGSADDKPRETGPPQRTAEDIVRAVEQYFEILSLVSGNFDSNNDTPPKAWICLMRKRE